MSSANNSCGCGCSPCVCTTSTTVGCVPDLCVPRPCFFNGQLIAADDLNAVVTYFRTRDAMLSRFVGGWGVLGGLQLGAPAGAQVSALSTQSVSPNPQIMVGTVAQISPGAALDSAGRTLALCSALSVDLTTLVSQTVAPTTKSCSTWFQGVKVPQCNQDIKYQEDGDRISNLRYGNQLTATSYWLVAQFTETPSRPVPQFTGGGACDPAPSCNYSRRIEGVQLSLVPALPSSYFLTGCLDAITLSLPVTFPSPVSTPRQTASPPSTSKDTKAISAAAKGSTTLLDDNPPGEIDQDPGTEQTTKSNLDCVIERYQIVDAINAQLAAACCTTPAVVLGQVLFTSSPGNLLGNLPANQPMYTILMDAYPFRRVVASAALDLFLLSELSCEQGPTGPTGATGPCGPGTVVATGIVGVALAAGDFHVPTPAPYPNTPAPIGDPKAYSYDPATGKNQSVPGQIVVTFDEYVQPSASGTSTFDIKAMVVEPQPVAAPGTQVTPLGISYSLAFDSFLPDGIALTLMGIGTTTNSDGSTSATAPVPVSWVAVGEIYRNTLGTLYIELEITRYPT